MSHPAASPDFWHSRWSANQIGFHEGAANASLQRWWPTLALAAGSRVFVPLCGKSADLAWLAAQGHEVVGVELSALAVQAFFAENGLTPERAEVGALIRWSAGRVTIYQGDVFAFDAPGRFDAAWDRAALIALPPDVRIRYATHVRRQLRADAPILVVTLVYDQARRDGPPFSVPDAELRAHHPEAVLLGREPAEARWDDIGGAENVVWRVR